MKFSSILTTVVAVLVALVVYDLIVKKLLSRFTFDLSDVTE